MVVRIGSNILSLNVQRQLSRASDDLSTATERLSSGQRINKASDDAAGLSISMSLDKDRLLSLTARRNVSDGISMVSILTSGIKSQKEILGRMVELAEQGANGTYSSKQREALQKEYGSLMDEFDRIADTTEFNGIKLLRNPTAQTIQLMVGITGGSDTALLQVAAANSHRFAGVVALRLNWNADVRITGADLSAENLYRGTSFLGTNTPNSRAHDGARFVVKAANGEDVDISLFPSAVTSHISAATTIAGSLN